MEPPNLSPHPDAPWTIQNEIEERGLLAALPLGSPDKVMRASNNNTPTPSKELTMSDTVGEPRSRSSSEHGSELYKQRAAQLNAFKEFSRMQYDQRQQQSQQQSVAAVGFSGPTSRSHTPVSPQSPNKPVPFNESTQVGKKGKPEISLLDPEADLRPFTCGVKAANLRSKPVDDYKNKVFKMNLSLQLAESDVVVRHRIHRKPPPDHHVQHHHAHPSQPHHHVQPSHPHHPYHNSPLASASEVHAKLSLTPPASPCPAQHAPERRRRRLSLNIPCSDLEPLKSQSRHPDPEGSVQSPYPSEIFLHSLNSPCETEIVPCWAPEDVPLDQVSSKVTEERSAPLPLLDWSPMGSKPSRHSWHQPFQQQSQHSPKMDKPLAVFRHVMQTSPAGIQAITSRIRLPGREPRHSAGCDMSKDVISKDRLSEPGETYHQVQAEKHPLADLLAPVLAPEEISLMSPASTHSIDNSRRESNSSFQSFRGDVFQRPQCFSMPTSSLSQQSQNSSQQPQQKPEQQQQPQPSAAVQQNHKRWHQQKATGRFIIGKYQSAVGVDHTMLSRNPKYRKDV